MVAESRRAERYAFTADAEVEQSAVVRKARVKDLCIHGCYLAMPDPFSKGAVVRIKIRTEIEFFQANATVAHATHGLGMGVMFHAVSPPFLIVLQYWLSEAQQERTSVPTQNHPQLVGESQRAKLPGGACMDKKKLYVPPRLTAYEPHNIPARFRDIPKPDLTPAYTTVVDNNRMYVEVSQSFCDLVGYKREELIGTRYDHLTALNTADIPATYNLFAKLGRMQGLWVLIHRTGYRILIRYEAWLREDSYIESKIEFVQNIV
jgi:PAS domain S-box-containing protein